MAKHMGETDPLFTHLWMPIPVLTSLPVGDMHVQSYGCRDVQSVEVETASFPEGDFYFRTVAASMGINLEWPVVCLSSP
eukprot:9212386-Pyramimonas_sp.AAC.1